VPYADPAKQRAAARRWREANREKRRATTRAWQAANREKARAASARWKAENQGASRAASNRWKAEHVEENREAQRRWRAANPDYARQHRARKKAAAVLAAVTPFALGEHVVHGVAGVGRIAGIERMEVLGAAFDAVVVEFPSPKTTLRIPVDRVAAQLRPLAPRETAAKALALLRQKPAAVGALVWAKRAAMFEAKLNSGAIIAIAEVARDTRGANRSDGAHAIHDRAVARLADELALIERTNRARAAAKIATLLEPKPRTP